MCDIFMRITRVMNIKKQDTFLGCPAFEILVYFILKVFYFFLRSVAAPASVSSARLVGSGTKLMWIMLLSLTEVTSTS